MTYLQNLYEQWSLTYPDPTYPDLTYPDLTYPDPTYPDPTYPDYSLIWFSWTLLNIFVWKVLIFMEKLLIFTDFVLIFLECTKNEEFSRKCELYGFLV